MNFTAWAVQTEKPQREGMVLVSGSCDETDGQARP